MSVILNTNQSTPFAGLGTWTYTVPTTGTYTVDCQATVPNEQGASGTTTAPQPVQSALQIVINLNGSPQVTVGGAANDPTPTQPSLGARATLQCTATDVITVVLTSSAAVDAAPNAVKGIINLFLGE